MAGLHILGLPLSKNSITEEFLNFIGSDTPTLLFSSVQFTDDEKKTNNDYITAKVGYDLLFDQGFKIIPGNLITPTIIDKTILSFPLWLSINGRRNASDVGIDIVKIYKQLQQTFPNVNIAYITPGSPMLYDFVVKKIIKIVDNIKIIDTKSSAELSYNYLLNYSSKIPNYPLNLITDQNDVKLTEESINIIGCIGPTYKINVNPILSQLSESDLIFTISIGYVTLVREHTLSELRKMFKNNHPYLNSATLAIIKSTD
jgi:hypothetical protein